MFNSSPVSSTTTERISLQHKMTSLRRCHFAFCASLLRLFSMEPTSLGFHAVCVSRLFLHFDGVFHFNINGTVKNAQMLSDICHLCRVQCCMTLIKLQQTVKKDALAHHRFAFAFSVAPAFAENLAGTRPFRAAGSRYRYISLGGASYRR